MSWDKHIDVKRVIAITLNKSEFAGINWLNPFFGLLVSIVIFGSAALFQAKRDLVMVGIIITAFFGVVTAVLLSADWLSKRILGQKMREQGKKPVGFANVLVVFRHVNEQNMDWTDLNLIAIDAVIALCEDGDVYYMPWVYYTRRPIVRIGREEITEIETGMQKIVRDRVQAEGTFETAAAIGTANSVMGGLDSVLPLDRERIVIKTASKNHEFLFHAKERAFAEKVLEAYKNFVQ